MRVQQAWSAPGARLSWSVTVALPASAFSLLHSADLMLRLSSWLTLDLWLNGHWYFIVSAFLPSKVGREFGLWMWGHMRREPLDYSLPWVALLCCYFWFGFGLVFIVCGSLESLSFAHVWFEFLFLSQQPFVLPYIPFVAVLDISFGLCIYVFGTWVVL